MLFDPNWETETKTDPFSLESLIAWLREQGPAEEYCYQDAGRCLAAQYFNAHGQKYHVWPTHASISTPEDKFRHLIENVAVVFPYTFGDALKRAMLAEREKG